jgi:outer membrane receptor protein involved in Fe transport
MKYSKRQHLKSLALAVSVTGSAFMGGLLFPSSAQSEELNTKLPATQDENFNVPVNVDLPKQPLAISLKEFARSSGLSLSFDNKLVDGKIAPAIKGRMTRKEVLRELLSNTGLTSELDGDSAVLKKLPDTSSTNIQLDQINVRAKRFYEIGPLPGLGLSKEQIPGNVQSITAKEIKESHSLSLSDLMNKKLQSVTVNDYQGNPFQMDIQYRGFTAGPQLGTPQGLSVFFDGIRVNEPFGDVVNWDMIPMNAIAGVDVFPGSNPVYGLNTLGGAFTMRTKDGFNNAGVDAEVLTGSFGRKQLQAEGGWNNGAVALFGAANIFLEDGWRKNSPSEVNQFFGKASYRGDKLDLNFSTLIVGNDLVGNGLVPSEMYEKNRRDIFTAPDTTKNRLQQFQLSAAFQATDNFSITGQAYRRKSKRDSVGGDVYTEFENKELRRNLNPGEQFTCLFATTNPYNLPDYYVMEIPNGDFFSSQAFLDFALAPTLEDAFATLSPASFNAELPPELVRAAQINFANGSNFQTSTIFQPSAGSGQVEQFGPVTPYSNDSNSYYYQSVTNLSSLKVLLNDPITYAVTNVANFYYYTPDADGGVGTLNALIMAPPTNADVCRGDLSDPSEPNQALTVFGPEGGAQTIDGAAYSLTNPGVVEGVPTAVIANNSIDQETDGASIQFNWNYDKHKFMIGASIDRPSATYFNSLQLGLLDANRNAYLAPDQILDQFGAATVPISNNNFDGDQITKSVYFSETWSPIETLHINGSARYNMTHGQNNIATRSRGRIPLELAQYMALPDYYQVCRPGEVCNTGYVIPNGANVLNSAEKEKFSYYSLNPSLGVSWQAKPTLNMYANFAQGVRVPSVIELGCALDKTLVPNGRDADGNLQYVYKSLQEGRSCTLPSALSGDPYLPQIKAQTWEAGLRGIFGENLQWNLSAYHTNLRDDLYLVTFPGGQSFFDTVGKTRRRGIEAGFSGQKDKWGFGLNYSLTDATFEDDFEIAGNDNSSSYEAATFQDFSRVIQVKPGDKMPGVAMHNLNANLNYQVTPKWQVGLTAIAHSGSFLRGNENNKHQKGVVLYDTVEIAGTDTLVPRRVSNNPGKVPGYMFFNFQTSYRFNSEWTASMFINNLFDKEYFTAGRLGRNPFTPGPYGAIGPDGYNHNSTEWASTNFIAPGAPRGVWFSLNWQFDPNAKPSF